MKAVKSLLLPVAVAGQPATTTERLKILLTSSTHLHFSSPVNNKDLAPSL
jgi:hypothetical protein